MAADGVYRDSDWNVLAALLVWIFACHRLRPTTLHAASHFHYVDLAASGPGWSSGRSFERQVSHSGSISGAVARTNSLC